MFERLFTHPLWAYRTGTFAFASAWPIGLLITSILVAAALVTWSLWRRRALGWRMLAPVGVLQTLLLALVLCLLWRPVLNVERVRDRENELAIAIDASSSMAYGDAGQSRLQEVASCPAERHLAAAGKNLRRAPVWFRAVHHAAEYARSDAAARPADAHRRRASSSATKCRQRALAGVILFSDGAENGDTLSEERLAEIASYGVPVHTVGLGPEASDRRSGAGARRGCRLRAGRFSTIDAQIGIRHNGASQARLRVYDRDNLVAARDIKLRAEAPPTQVSLDLPAGQAGTHELRFVLDPLEGERNVINNSRTRVVNVPATRRGILYVEGEPRWEYKFLRRAVDNDRALRVASIVRTTTNKHYRQGVNSPDELVDGFPSDPAELFGYDAVIIGSYEAAGLRAEQHRLLKDFVDKRGGTVLMLAGRYGLSAGGWQNAALAQTLPVQLTGKQPTQFVQRPGQAVLTMYGAESPIPRLDVDPRKNQDRWKNLPPLADYQSLGRLKPGAVVLLEANGEQGRSPLLVWQHYGRGATYVLATASTLRWQMRMPSDDQSHEIFWRQLLHAISSTASGPAHRERRAHRA